MSSTRNGNPAVLESGLQTDLITISERIMHGTPCFSGTRVPVKTLFDYLQAGDSLERFLNHFPDVQPKQAAGLLARIGEKIDASSDGTIDLS